MLDPDAAALDAIRAGDEAAFAGLVERHRRSLHLHCYRMSGSAEEAEDLVQETLLRAWRGRGGFEGRASLRTWLHRIATNVCSSRLQRAPRRVMPIDLAPPVTADTPASEARSTPPWAPELPWLGPYPDRWLVSAEPGPDEIAVTREQIALAFLHALQHLPARQRAALLLRDVLGASAREVAATLGVSVAAANSALQRARSTLAGRLPAPSAPTEAEQAALGRFVRAWEAADDDALIRLLRKDARWSMPPAPLWFAGRDAIAALYRRFPIGRLGTFRMTPTGCNLQPAAAAYLRRTGAADHELVAVHVLRVDGDEIADVVTFAPAMCAGFGLPPRL